MASTHGDVDDTVQEISQYISQEAMSYSLRYNVVGILDGYEMLDMWDI